MSEVFIVKGKGVVSNSREFNQKKLQKMYLHGFYLLTGKKVPQEAISALFSKNDKIGIKINTIAGKKLSTLPSVSFPLAYLFIQGGIKPKNIIIWDRTNRELKQAGYNLNINQEGIQIYATDTQDIGYSNQPVSHLNIGSLFSNIQKNIISSSISLAILKDHGMSGVTAGMKNYFGTIHNPNKYHDNNCDPYVAELFDIPLIKNKHRLSILDALIVQYHLGPSYHPSWAEKYEALIFSLDPVAADRAGWKLIEELRSKKGLPTLEEEGRRPSYLFTAQQMGLGQANLDNIQIKTVEV